MHIQDGTVRSRVCRVAVRVPSSMYHVYPLMCNFVLVVVVVVWDGRQLLLQGPQLLPRTVQVLQLGLALLLLLPAHLLQRQRARQPLLQQLTLLLHLPQLQLPQLLGRA